MKRTIGRTIGLLAAATLVALAPVLPAQAITYGTPDAGAHPMVGQLFYYNPGVTDPRFTSGGSWYSCSGTLVSPTVVVTSGHCTYPIGHAGTDVWFDVADTPDLSTLAPSDCFANNPDYTPDPTNLATCATKFGFKTKDFGTGDAARYAQWTKALNQSKEWIHATAHTSPYYDPATFPYDDLGALVLDSGLPGPYAELPSVGLVDTMYNSDKNATYTVVGYGRQGSSPLGDWGGGTRYDGTVTITNLNGVWGYGKDALIALSSNNGTPHSGGTCYGDSGGPAFSIDPVTGANVVFAVTSFGTDPYCNNGTGAYRLDLPANLDFITSFFG